MEEAVLTFPGREFSGEAIDFERLSSDFAFEVASDLSVSFTARWDRLDKDVWGHIICFGRSPQDSGPADLIRIFNRGDTETLTFEISHGPRKNYRRVDAERCIKIGEVHTYLCTVSSAGHMHIHRDDQIIGQNLNGWAPQACRLDHLLVGSNNQCVGLDGSFHQQQAKSCIVKKMFTGRISNIIVWNRVVAWSELWLLGVTSVDSDSWNGPERNDAAMGWWDDSWRQTTEWERSRWGQSSWSDSKWQAGTLDVWGQPQRQQKDDMKFSADAQPSKSLRQAAATNDVRTIKSLLANRAVLQQGDGSGKTALHYAARDGSPDAVRVLLACRADPNVADKNGEQPLDEAYWWLVKKPQPGHPSIILQLEERGAVVSKLFKERRWKLEEYAKEKGTSVPWAVPSSSSASCTAGCSSESPKANATCDVVVLDALNLLKYTNSQESSSPHRNWDQVFAAGKYYVGRGKRVYVFIRRGRCRIPETQLRTQLGDDCLVFCPSSEDDDKFMINYVQDYESETGSLVRIVTCDLFRNHACVTPEWVSEHTVSFSFVGDRFVPAKHIGACNSLNRWTRRERGQGNANGFPQEVAL